MFFYFKGVPEAFAERLCYARSQKGVSQQTVADSLGVSRNLLSNYERGVRQPDFQMLCDLAKFYGTSTDFLLGMTDEYSPRKKRCKRDAMIINQILTLNDDSKEALQEYITLLKLKEEKSKGL
ncbi:MAG: helix-turn-helix domain-containing protein [Ruminococcus sp.]